MFLKQGEMTFADHVSTTTKPTLLWQYDESKYETKTNIKTQKLKQPPPNSILHIVMDHSLFAKYKHSPRQC